MYKTFLLNNFFNYKINKIILFVFSGMTVFYIKGKYLKYTQFFSVVKCMRAMKYFLPSAT